MKCQGEVTIPTYVMNGFVRPIEGWRKGRMKNEERIKEGKIQS